MTGQLIKYDIHLSVFGCKMPIIVYILNHFEFNTFDFKAVSQKKEQLHDNFSIFTIICTFF